MASTGYAGGDLRLFGMSAHERQIREEDVDARPMARGYATPHATREDRIVETALMASRVVLVDGEVWTRQNDPVMRVFAYDGLVEVRVSPFPRSGTVETLGNFRLDQANLVKSYVSSRYGPRAKVRIPHVEIADPTLFGSRNPQVEALHTLAAWYLRGIQTGLLTEVRRALERTPFEPRALSNALRAYVRHPDNTHLDMEGRVRWATLALDLTEASGLAPAQAMDDETGSLRF